MKRAIVLPNGRKCSLHTYVKAWRTLLACDHAETICSGFFDFPHSAGDILTELRYGLHDRINRHDTRYGVGRKWSPDWQRAAGHTAREVNTPRLIVRYVPTEFRSRLSHRITSEV